jgi:KDO2-lipid IV(A) lauroyltransferase
MSKVLSALKGRVTAASYATAWWLVCRMPESWGRWVFQQAGEIAWRRQGTGVQLLEANLRRVIGPEPPGKELRALSRAGMHSYARYWFEVFRLPVISAERLIADMRCEGKDRLLGTLASGRGAVLPLPHMGNWDQAGAWVIACGVPKFTTVAERLKPESLARRFFAFREGLGFEVLPATGGVQRFGILAQRLRAGGLVCLPADRDITGGGIEVDFFGEKAHMMGGAAALAVQTGAALMPVTLWFDGPLWGAHIHEEIPVPAEGTRREKVAAMTQQVARVFEAGIAEHPEDWHMLQRVFSADLDLARLAAAQATARAAEEAEGAAEGAALGRGGGAEASSARGGGAEASSARGGGAEASSTRGGGAEASSTRGGGAEASSGRSGEDRAGLNGQVGGAAPDGLADGAGTAEGGSGP